ncbi:MFS transporter [Nocardioides insulae]|uniref:MFS transporter n=1 Tax=Nocardioides insulae TaxID=394734 RepID=UPI000419559E|nr:MFS transporter [Nocardioides insulae]
MASISALAPFRVPHFAWYFGARAVNQAGHTMAPVALAFGVLALTDAPGALGAVLAAHMVPMVALLLAGGVIADRFGRRRVIQASNILSGLTQGSIALLMLTGNAEIWHLVALSALNGVASAAAMPALMGLVPQLVPRQLLQQANVLLSLTRASLMILGPSLAALLVVTVGPGWALAVDSLTWLLSAALLIPVRIPPPAAVRASMVAELRDGWRYFRATTWLWLMVGAFAILNALHEGGITTLGPARATQTGIGEGGWGLALSAQAVGALAATLIFMRWSLQRPLVVGVLGNILYGLPMIVLALWPSTWPLLISTFLAGFGVQTFSLGWHLAMQENVPQDMLSRAYSYDQLGSFVAIPIGQLAMGPLAAAHGMSEVLLLAGLAYVTICVLTLASPAVRHLARA